MWLWLVPQQLTLDTVIGLVIAAHLTILLQANAGLVYPFITNYHFLEYRWTFKKIAFSTIMLIIWIGFIWRIWEISPLAAIASFIVGAWYMPFNIIKAQLWIYVVYKRLVNKYILGN